MKDNIIRLLEKNKDEPIFFWGASLYLRNFISKNNLSKFNIIGIIDSNPSLKNKNEFGFKVYAPDVLLKYKAKIIITIKNNHKEIYEEIYNKLKKIKQENYLLENPFLEKNQEELNSIITNKLYLIDSNGKKHQVSYIPGLNIQWNGANSKVEIGCSPLPRFLNSKIVIGSNSSVKIGSSTHTISKMDIDIQKDNSKVIIGEDFSCNQVSFWLTGESNKKITVGSNCMFSREITIRTSDVHAIFEKDSKKLLNKGKNITIGNNVWIAQRVLVHKGAKIPDGCIVGSNSMVNKVFNKNNAVIAGYPAKITKENVEWARSTIDSIINQ